jgi:hypothetical protein
MRHDGRFTNHFHGDLKVNQISPANAGPGRTSVSSRPSAAPVRPTASRRFDELVAAVVFGIPFTYCLHGALRGHLFLGNYKFFGPDSQVSGLTAWAVTMALGSLWLGVTLHLGLIPRLPERIRNASAVGLILAGAALLLFSARLLGLRAAS